MSWNDNGRAVPLMGSTGAVVGHLLTTGTSTVALSGSTTQPTPIRNGPGTAVVSIPEVGGVLSNPLQVPGAGGVDVDVRLPEVSQPLVTSWFLRMYLPYTSQLFANSLTNSASAKTWTDAISPGTPASIRTGGVLPAPLPHHYFYRLDSEQDDARFELDLGTAAGGFVPTGIPNFQANLTLDTSVLSGVGSTTAVTQGWDIKYEHPRVVQTPSGEWLMLLARQLIPIGSSTSTEERLENVFSGLDDPASQSIRDIVAYLSPTPDFKSVYGPILLASSLGAMPNQTLRVWPGVPTGAFVDNTLHLFYTVQPSSSAFEQDAVGAIDYRTLVSTEFSDDRLSEGKGIIAVKTIAWADLQTAFLTHAAESSLLADAVLGTLEGRVRFSIATGTKPSVEPLLDVLEQHLADRYALDFSTASDRPYLPNIVDPDVVLCPDGTLSIYVAVRSGTEVDHLDGGTGMGIWRGVAFRTGLGSLFTLGTRFLMAEMTATGSSADLVLASDRASAESEGGSYIDPDAVLLPDGSARVFCSGRARADGTTPYGVVVEVSGSAADACADWESAWG